MYFQKVPSIQGKSWRLQGGRLRDSTLSLMRVMWVTRQFIFTYFLHISVGTLTHLTMEVILESVSEGTFDLRSVGIMVYLGVNLS